MEHNLEIRRNIFTQSGKNLTAAIKENQSNGEQAKSNGSASADSTGKAIEDIVKEPKKSFHCYSCGVDCTRTRFHYSKSAPTTAGAVATKIKFDLCPACFQHGRFAGSPLEFVKLEDEGYMGVPDRDAPWSDTELLLLLEALEVFDENWNAIADHVGTRTREQCVVKFLQLEIDDKYIESEIADQPSFGPLNRGRIPFSQADNPVMSVIAYLAAMNNPEVTAAAVGRSVEEMRKQIRHRLENGFGATEPEHEPEPEPEPAPENDKTITHMGAEDYMEIDMVGSPQPTAENQVIVVEEEEEAENPNNPNPHPDDATTLSNVAFAASAARAVALASNEEREMTRLVSAALNRTLEKLELKLEHFSAMQAVQESERREIERSRQQMLTERFTVRRRMTEAEESFKAMSLKNGGGGSAAGDDGSGAAGAGAGGGAISSYSGGGGVGTGNTGGAETGAETGTGAGFSLNGAKSENRFHFAPPRRTNPNDHSVGSLGDPMANVNVEPLNPARASYRTHEV